MSDATDFGLVLAVHPTSRGFGWVLFEAPFRPVDWGLASAKVQRPTRLVTRFERILKRYGPAVLVLEAFEGASANRAQNIQTLCRTMLEKGAGLGLRIAVYDRDVVRGCFARFGATTRFEIARCIGDLIAVFGPKVPPKRKAWNNEHPRQCLFDAAALALTFYAVMGEAIEPAES